MHTHTEAHTHWQRLQSCMRKTNASCLRPRLIPLSFRVSHKNMFMCERASARATCRARARTCEQGQDCAVLHECYDMRMCLCVCIKVCRFNELHSPPRRTERLHHARSPRSQWYREATNMSNSRYVSEHQSQVTHHRYPSTHTHSTHTHTRH